MVVSISEDDKLKLLRLMDNLSPGDVSILQHSLENPADTQLLTVPGSPNDALWSAMMSLGWMTMKEQQPELAGKILTNKLFKYSPEYLESVAELLAEFRRVKGDRDQKLAALQNKLVGDIPPQIFEPVKQLGGNAADLTMMLIAVVTGTMARYVKQETQAHYVDGLCERRRHRFPKPMGKNKE